MGVFMKYIVYLDNGEEHMVLFPSGASLPEHVDVANALGLRVIVSAGFFMEIAGRKKFMGESMSLGIESRGDVDKDLYIEQSRRA